MLLLLSASASSADYFDKIDWQPDNLTFLLDDKVVRIVNKVDTFDADGIAHYPTTPSSIQIRYLCAYCLPSRVSK